MQLPVATLEKGREKLPLRHHPWVYSGAVQDVRPRPDGASMVRLEDIAGNFIAYGWYDNASHIALRLLSWDERQIPDDRWWKTMVARSIMRRKQLIRASRSRTTAWRLVHGEADGLPGLVVDLYNDVVLCTISASAAWRFKDAILESVGAFIKPSALVVETDRSFRTLESLPASSEWFGSDKLDQIGQSSKVVWFKENGLLYSMVPGLGQKTGFFCDQRENRNRVASHASGMRMLDAFCYTGGFALNALRAGALSVVAVDSSRQALDTLIENAQKNVDFNKLPANCLNSMKTEKANAFEYLRDMPSDAFDLIVLDPPKLAKSQGDLDSAAKAYKDINRLACKKIAANGIVATFSCSGAVSREYFRTILAWAAHESGRNCRIIETLGQPADHPVRLSFPESEYLKGFIIAVE